VTRSSKLPGAKDEELIVEASDESPEQSATERPDNEEGLEVEVEQHTCSRNVNLAQVGFDRPCMTLLTGHTRHEDLGTRTPGLGLFHCLLIDGRSAAKVHDPYDDNKAYRKDEADDHDRSPIFEVALPFDSLSCWINTFMQGET